MNPDTHAGSAAASTGLHEIVLRGSRPGARARCARSSRRVPPSRGRRQRSAVGLRPRACRRRSPTRARAHGAVRLLDARAGECFAAPSGRPTIRAVIPRRSGSRRAARGPQPARAPRRAHRHRVRGARLSHRLGLEGVPGPGLGVRHLAAEGAHGRRAARSADLHAGEQGRSGPRRQHLLRGDGRARRRDLADDAAPPQRRDL